MDMVIMMNIKNSSLMPNWYKYDDVVIVDVVAKNSRLLIKKNCKILMIMNQTNRNLLCKAYMFLKLVPNNHDYQLMKRQQSNDLF